MLRSALLYTALLFGANAAFAGAVDWQAARDAGLVKLVPAEEPAPVSDVEFTDPKGGTHTLADYKGKVVLLNFWATWCAPCREEMPSLDALQKEHGDALAKALAERDDLASAKDAEIAALKKEVARLRAERDILKKAAAFFAREAT